MGKAIAKFGASTGSGSSAPGLNIVSFGAVGDGTTDNSTAIQNAINAAMDAGCALYVPPGNFAFGTTIQIAGPLTLYGLTESFLNGGWLGPNGKSGSRLTYTGSGTAIDVACPSNANSVNYRVILRYLSIGTGLSIASSAPPPAGTVAIAVTCEESEFEHLEIAGFDTGIMVTHLAISSIHDCQFACNNDHINVPPNTSFAFVLIYRNNFFAASRSGIRLNSGVSIWMRFNYFEACQYSLWVENSTGFPQLYTCLFSDNDVNTNTSPGGWLGTAIANGRAIMIESTTTANGVLVETLTIHNNMLHTDTGGISVIDVWAHSNPNVNVTLDVQLNSLWGGTQGAIYSDCPTCYVGGRDNNCQTEWCSGVAVPLLCPTYAGQSTQFTMLGGDRVTISPLTVAYTPASQGEHIQLAGSPTGISPNQAVIGFYPDNAGTQRGYIGFPNAANMELQCNSGGIYLLTATNNPVSIMMPGASSGLAVGRLSASFNPAGLLHVADRTASSGATKVVFEAGQGQGTTNLLEFHDDNGNVLSAITSTGAFTGGTGSSAPTGPAGGDLTGTYPNPTIATVGGATAAAIATVAAYGVSVPTNPNTIVVRDAYGDVFASQFTCAGNVVLTAQGTSYQYYNTNAPGKLRWALGMTTDPETGGNAGSNWNMWVYNDAGTYLGTAISIARATLATTFYGALAVSSLAYAAGLGTAAPTASTLVARDTNGQSKFISVNCGGTSAGAVQLTGGSTGSPGASGKVQFFDSTGAEVANLGNGNVSGEIDLFLDGVTNFCIRGAVYQGGWNGVTTYAATNIVSSGGLYYVSLQNGNLNNPPASSPSWWAVTAGNWVFCYLTPSSSSGAMVTVDAAQTISNKTISGSTNTFSNIPASAVGATNANTANAIVQRDSTGSFSTGTITAAQLNSSGNLVSFAQGAGLQFYNTNAAGKCRWAAILSTGAETGGNAGSGWQLWAYSDTGAALGMPFEVVRANQAVYFYGPGPYIDNPQNSESAAVTCGGTQTLSNKTVSVGGNTCQIPGKGDLISTGAQTGNYTANLTINGATPAAGLYTVRAYMAVPVASGTANASCTLNRNDGIGGGSNGQKSLSLVGAETNNANGSANNTATIYSNGSAISISVAYSGTGEWQGYFQIIAA